MYPISRQTITEYFMGSFADAKKKNHLEISPEAEFYVVNLASEFSSAERVRAANPKDDAFAIAYKNAMENLGFESSKSIGDLSTFLCGFFPERVDRAGGLKYHITMGRSGYNLASIFPGQKKYVFKELVEKLPRIVDTLNDIGINEVSADKDIIEVYEKWLKTGSSRLKKILIKNGIMPVKDIMS